MCVGESSLELSISDSLACLAKMDVSLLNINALLDRTMICLSIWYMKYESEIALLKGPWLTMSMILSVSYTEKFAVVDSLSCRLVVLPICSFCSFLLRQLPH